MRFRVPPVLWICPHAHDGTKIGDLDCSSQWYLNRSNEKVQLLKLSN